MLSTRNLAGRARLLTPGVAILALLLGGAHCIGAAAGDSGGPTAADSKAPAAASWNNESRPQGWLDRLALALSPSLRALNSRREAVARELLAATRPIQGPTSASLGFHSVPAGSPATTKWVQVDLGRDAAIDLIALVPAHVVLGDHPGPGYGFPRRFKVEISGDADFSRAQLAHDQTAEDLPNPGNFPVVIESSGRRARYVRVTATHLRNEGGFSAFALGELMVLGGEQNLALGKTVTASDATETPPQWSKANLVDGLSALGLPVDNVPSPSNGYHSYENEKRQDTAKWVQVDLGRVLSIDEVRLIPARPRDYAMIPAFGFPIRFRIEAALEPGFAAPLLLRDEEHQDFRNPGENPVIFPCSGQRARYVRITAARLWSRGDAYAFALAEFQVYSGNTNHARGAAVTARDSVESGYWSRQALVDGFSSQQRLVELTAWLRTLRRGPELGAELRRLGAEQERQTNEVLRSASRGLLIVLAAGALALGFLSYRYRLLRLLEVERLRTRIATDLHDELGTRLTRIGLLTDLLQRHTDPAHPASAQASQIAAVTREIVHSMDEIVWAVNPRNDTLEDLANYVFHFAEQFFKDSPVRLRLDVPPDLPPLHLPTEVRHQVFLAIKEGLNNVLRHARASQARVAFALNDDWLAITITDDGQGFDSTSAATHGNGLRNMQARMHSIGGRLEIRSVPRPGHDPSAAPGTTLQFHIKVPPERRKRS